MAWNLDYDPNWKPDGQGNGGKSFNLDYDPNWTPEKKPEGGLVASLKQTGGHMVKSAGQLAADVLPGVDRDNALTRTGQGIIDANPTAVHSLSDVAESPWTATKEAVGNAAASIGGVVGARLLGQGITAAAPLAGPAAPLVAGIGQGISWLGPTAMAALPSYGGIREQQIAADPNNEGSLTSKALAGAGAATVGLIENRFGPQEWALKALSQGGRDALAKQFAANSLVGAIGKGAVKGAAIEGAEELVQNPIEQLASYQDPTTAANLQDTAFGGVMGALGGGVLGGGAGGLSRMITPSQQEQPTQPPQPTIDPNAGPLSKAASMATQTPELNPLAFTPMEPTGPELETTEQEQARMRAAQFQADAMPFEPSLSFEQGPQPVRATTQDGMPFERIAPEDYDTLNPIRAGEGELLDAERPTAGRTRAPDAIEGQAQQRIGVADDGQQGNQAPMRTLGERVKPAQGDNAPTRALPYFTDQKAEQSARKALPFATEPAAQKKADELSKKRNEPFTVIPHPALADRFAVVPSRKLADRPTLQGGSQDGPSADQASTDTTQGGKRTSQASWLESRPSLTSSSLNPNYRSAANVAQGQAAARAQAGQQGAMSRMEQGAQQSAPDGLAATAPPTPVQTQPATESVSNGLPPAEQTNQEAEAARGQEGAKETRDELLARYKRAELFSDESFALSDRLKDSTRKEVGAKIAAGEMPVFDTGSETFATITPSAQKPGSFQVTRYNRYGVMGDSQYASVDDALAREFFHQKRMIPQAEAEQRFAESLQAEAKYQSARNQQSAQTQPQAQQADQFGDGNKMVAQPSQEFAQSSLQGEPASWVIRNKETGEVVMETYDRAKVNALNTKKYEAVPIQQYLGGVNRKIREQTNLARTQGADTAPVAQAQGERNGMQEEGRREEVAPESVAESVATHKDPGQPAEPVTAPVIAQAIKKSARNTEFNPVEARNWLIGEIDKAIENAPSVDRLFDGVKIDNKHATYAGVKTWNVDGPKDEDGLTPSLKIEEGKKSGYRVVWGKDPDQSSKAPNLELAKEDAARIVKTGRFVFNEQSKTGSWEFDAGVLDAKDFVTFDVPGDGKFKVVNTVEKLNDFKAKVKSSPGFAKNPDRPTSLGGTGLAPAVPLGKGMMDLPDIGNAIEIARLKNGKDEDTLLDRFKEASGGKDYDAWRAEQEAAEEIAAREEAQAEQSPSDSFRAEVERRKQEREGPKQAKVKDDDRQAGVSSRKEEGRQAFIRGEGRTAWQGESWAKERTATLLAGDWLKGYDEAKADADAIEARKWLQVVVLPSEYPTQDVDSSYAHISHSGAARAKDDRDSFVSHINALFDAAMQKAETPEQREAANKAIQEYKSEYLRRLQPVIRVRSQTYSGFVAGRAKINTRQADSRNSALDRAIEAFSSWVKSASSAIMDAVLAARNSDQLAAERQAKESKESKKREQQEALISKILNFRPGDDVKFGSYKIARVTNGRDGYPSSVTVDATDMTDNKFDLARTLFGGDKEKLRAIVDAVRSKSQQAQEQPKQAEQIEQPSATAAQEAQPESFPVNPELESLFESLDGTSTRKANKAKKAIQSDPRADKINMVQDKFLDILQALEDSGAVKINCK